MSRFIIIRPAPSKGNVQWLEDIGKMTTGESNLMNIEVTVIAMKGQFTLACKTKNPTIWDDAPFTFRPPNNTGYSKVGVQTWVDNVIDELARTVNVKPDIIIATIVFSTNNISMTYRLKEED